MNRCPGIVLAAKSRRDRSGQISLRRLQATSVAYNSGAASATPFAALSGANHKAPGFAGGYFTEIDLMDRLEFCAWADGRHHPT